MSKRLFIATTFITAFAAPAAAQTGATSPGMCQAIYGTLADDQRIFGNMSPLIDQTVGYDKITYATRNAQLVVKTKDHAETKSGMLASGQRIDMTRARLMGEMGMNPAAVIKSAAACDKAYGFTPSATLKGAAAPAPAPAPKPAPAAPMPRLSDGQCASVYTLAEPLFAGKPQHQQILKRRNDAQQAYLRSEPDLKSLEASANIAAGAEQLRRKLGSGPAFKTNLGQMTMACDSQYRVPNIPLP